MTKARPPEKDHTAIRSVSAAKKWLEDLKVRPPETVRKAASLPIYSRAMAAAVQMRERAATFRALKARYKQLQDGADSLKRDCPGFEYSLGDVPLPAFEARAISLEILVGQHPVPLNDDQEGQAHRLAIFLDRVFVDQSEDQLRVAWEAPSRKKATHGFLSVEQMIQVEQLARVVADGVGQILELIPLGRSEVPILAVAAGVDGPAKQSGDALRDEFEDRADRWRQRPALVAKRLRRLVVGLVPLSNEAYIAAMRSLFSAPDTAAKDASTVDVPRNGHLDEKGRRVRSNRRKSR